MNRTLILTAAFSLLAFTAPSAMAQEGNLQLQGAPQPSPDTPLYNLQKGQVTTDTPRPAVGAQANVEAYPSDGSEEHRDANTASARPQNLNKDFPQ